MKRLRSFLINGLLLFCSICIVLVGMELFLRSFYPQPLFPMIYELDIATGYRLKSNFTGIHSSKEYRALIRTNSEGLRDKGYSITKRRDTFRILVLGDSLTFGYGVSAENSYPKVLEDLLKKEANRKFEVVNASIPGYGTSQEYLYLKEYGLRYKPDLIIVGFFIGNDLDDNLNTGFFTVKDGKLVTSEGQKNFYLKNRMLVGLLSGSPVYLYLSQNSHLLSFLKLRISILISKYLEKGSGERFARNLYSDAGDAEVGTAMEITKALFSEISNAVKRHGAEVLFVLIPSKEQLAPASYGLVGEGYNAVRPSTELESFCKKNGFKVLDLFQYFSGVDNLYFKEENHLTSKGNQLTAELLNKTIKDMQTK